MRKTDSDELLLDVARELSRNCLLQGIVPLTFLMRAADRHTYMVRCELGTESDQAYSFRVVKDFVLAEDVDFFASFAAAQAVPTGKTADTAEAFLALVIVADGRNRALHHEIYRIQERDGVLAVEERPLDQQLPKSFSGFMANLIQDAPADEAARETARQRLARNAGVTNSPVTIMKYTISHLPRSAPPKPN
ncbi:MAG: hypothetical protein CVV05_01100 [Gammaproteobacteria bacterium HGW-Gammaproteobacteria-1]|jgi:hypothetical protein|nr:MAG: hypothetical protein CVV05_01100 [Gammaproteobacteria bacterium HGW-Gammaproteobacteria-1]